MTFHIMSIAYRSEQAEQLIKASIYPMLAYPGAVSLTLIRLHKAELVLRAYWFMQGDSAARPKQLSVGSCGLLSRRDDVRRRSDYRN